MDEVLVYIVPNSGSSQVQRVVNTDDEGIEHLFGDCLILKNFPVDESLVVKEGDEHDLLDGHLSPDNLAPVFITLLANLLLGSHR